MKEVIALKEVSVKLPHSMAWCQGSIGLKLARVELASRYGTRCGTAHDIRSHWGTTRAMVSW